MSTVLLTGANGFIAVPITRMLLERGYQVVGTVRSMSKTEFLLNKFSAYGDKLKYAVVEDITKPGAFDEVLNEYKPVAIVHTSSPYTFKVTDVEKELYEPAIKGTTEILKSIHSNAPSVKRVVITSSFAAIVNLGAGNAAGHVYSEKYWNPITYEAGLADPVSGYYGSKTYAEKAAWEFMDTTKPSFSLTVLNPPMVYGPSEAEAATIDKLNTSLISLYNILNGLAEPKVGVWIWVDVRDIALAHVLAIETPAAANQRYLITAGRYSPQQFVDFAWNRDPQRAEAKGVSKGTPGQLYPAEGIYDADNSKSIRDLGLKYRGVEEMLGDTWTSFEEIENKAK